MGGKKFIFQEVYCKFCEQVIGNPIDDNGGGGVSLWQYIGDDITPISGDADLLIERAVSDTVISRFVSDADGDPGNFQDHEHELNDGVLFPHVLRHEIAPGELGGPDFLKAKIFHSAQVNLAYWIANRSSEDPVLWSVLELGDDAGEPDYALFNLRSTQQNLIRFYDGVDFLNAEIFSDATSGDLELAVYNRRLLLFTAESRTIPFNDAFRADLSVFPVNYRTVIGAINYNFEQIAAIVPGESNTSSNQGTGQGLALAKVGVDLPFKTITAGANITLTPSANELEIAAAGGAGEANTSSNQGTGQGLALAKVGVDLPFKTITAGANITLTPSANELEIAAAGGGSAITTVETMHIGEAAANRFLTGTTPNGALTTLAAIPLGSFTVNNMAFWIAQNAAGGTAGLGIYDRTGVLLGNTALVACAIGLNVIPLLAPVALSGNIGYYFALSTDINSIAPLSQASNYNPPSPSPPMSFYVPNVNTVDPSGFPANISAYFGQTGQAEKYWIAAYT